MAFTVTSTSFKDGDYLPKDFILSADFGFGCAAATPRRISRGPTRRRGRKASPSPATTRRADRLRLLALAGGEYPGDCGRACARRGQCRRQAAGGGVADPHRFRRARLRRPVPPAGDHPHRYLFNVFAVSADKLDVKADTSAAVVGFNLHFNTLAKASIMALFKR